MSLTVILSFVVTTIISALMIPLVIKAGNQLGIVAHMNKRTSSNKCYYGCRIYNFYGRAL